MASLRVPGMGPPPYPFAPGEPHRVPATHPPTGQGYPTLPTAEGNGGRPPPIVPDDLPVIDSGIPQPQPGIPQSPYGDAAAPIYATATAWFQQPWVLPVGVGVSALLLGLTVGVAVGRRKRSSF